MRRRPHVFPEGANSPDGRHSFKHAPHSSYKACPEPVSVARSVQPAPRPPFRSIENGYDEGVFALIGHAQRQYCGRPPSQDTTYPPEHPAQSPAISRIGKQGT